MNCPRCNYLQFCPCENCQASEKHGTPEGFKPWIWEPDGKFIRCAGCGFRAHADWWETWAMWQHEGRHISPIMERKLFGYEASRPGRSWRVFDFCDQLRHVVITRSKPLEPQTALMALLRQGFRRTSILNMQTGNQDYYV